jgi:hypothetical protein
MSDFILDPDNSDVLKSRILVMEVLCSSKLGLAHSVLLQFTLFDRDELDQQITGNLFISLLT